MHLRRCIPWIVCLFLLPVGAVSQQRSLAPDQMQIVSILTTMYAAAMADDTARFDALIVPGFYMFDNGKRFEGDAIMGLIKSAHAAGMHYDWTVTEPDVHVTGKTAWVAYINRGIITDAKGNTQKMVWLESADLVKQRGVWKLAFLESEPAPALSQ